MNSDVNAEPKSVMQFRYVCWGMCLERGKFVNQVLIVAFGVSEQSVGGRGARRSLAPLIIAQTNSR
jgi:hypothetical protein